MKNYIKTLLLLGFGLMGLIAGVYLENIRAIPSPFALAVSAGAMCVGFYVMKRRGLL